MQELNTVMSMAGIDEADRLKRVKAAAEDVLTRLQTSFPEAEGYRFKVVDTTPQECGFCRDIRGRRGLNWGLYVLVKGTDQKMSGVRLTVGRESKLTTILGIGGFFGAYGVISWFVVSQLLSAYGEIDLRNSDQLIALGLLVFIGLPLAGVFATRCIGFISRPLLEVSEATAKELMETTTTAWTTAGFPTLGSANTQASNPNA